MVRWLARAAVVIAAPLGSSQRTIRLGAADCRAPVSLSEMGSLNEMGEGSGLGSSSAQGRYHVGKVRGDVRAYLRAELVSFGTGDLGAVRDSGAATVER